MQGIWYEKAASGCGWLVFVSVAGVAAYYFGNDGQSRPLWLHGFGTPDSIERLRSVGTGFRTNPASVATSTVGTLRLEQRGDNELRVTGEILTSLIDPGFSPPPPEFHMSDFEFVCERLLPTL